MSSSGRRSPGAPSAQRPDWRPWSRWILVLCLIAAGWRCLPRFLAARGFHSQPSVERLQAAVRRAPDDPGYHFRLGVATRDLPEARDLEQSRIHLERAVELNPLSWRYRRELGLLHELSGRMSEAEESYLESVRLNRGSADYRWRLAHFYMRIGSLDKAPPHFRAALQADPRRRRSALAFLLKSGAALRDVAAVWPTDREAREELVRLLCQRQDVEQLPGIEAFVHSLRQPFVDPPPREQSPVASMRQPFVDPPPREQSPVAEGAAYDAGDAICAPTNKTENGRLQR